MTDFDTIRDTVDPSGTVEGSYVDADTIQAAAQAVRDRVSGEPTGGAEALIEEIGTEQDGFVLGIQGSEARVGFQEQTNTEVLDDDGNVVSSDTLTYGAYLEGDGDIALGITREGTRSFDDGELSYGISAELGTEGFSSSGAAVREWDTGLADGESGISGYGIAGGYSFEQGLDGSEADWSAAVIGEVTYESEMLQQWGAYAFTEVGVYADPSGVDAVARAGLGRETGFGDVRVGLDQDGGASFTIGKSF